MKQEPIERIRFDAGKLIEEHPPQWHHRNKSVVFDVACSSGFPFEGEIVYARWPEILFPQNITTRSRFLILPGVFDYVSSTESANAEWHLNFADPHLFIAYGSSLLAQDELQVAEHPILGSLREALDSMGRPPQTVDSHRRPTPITIAGVQRRCAIETQRNVEAGRPAGLYGNAFARASEEEVLSATKPISPPTISNILAMAAPACGHGDYTRDQISYVAVTAYTGFLAARWESENITPCNSRAVIHTGFWGCGAFGGNRELMTILQALAADLAEVDVVFHAFDEAGVALADSAVERFRNISDSASSVSQLLDLLTRHRFQWGESDGN